MAELDPTPVGSFRFELTFMEGNLTQGGSTERVVAGGAFSECTGLEGSMEPKVIREGGLNYGVHQRAGPVTFATVILRRGITANSDLWKWFALTTQGGGFAYRMNLTIRHLGLDGVPVRSWQLMRAMPVKLKSADLNAKGTDIAIEELHLVHEGLLLS
jgi:phage tail-like protein